MARIVVPVIASSRLGWGDPARYTGKGLHEFFRHAYFLYGGKDTKDGPYEKLKKALRAEIDEGEWSKLYSATSQPFDPPTSRARSR